MTERRSWTEEEDNALKYLKDVLQVKKWSQISRKLQFQFNLPGRNGKQCRQRYTNHLDSSIISKEFTPEDEQRLFKLHDKIGNKWSLISKEFTGRTDNHIKNNFHSKLRKAIRKLNKQIRQHFKKSHKPFKLSLIYKVVEASDYRFSPKLALDQENFIDFNQLKNYLLQYAGGLVIKTELSDMKSKDQTLFLVSRLNQFEKYFKDKKFCVKSTKVKSNHSSIDTSKNALKQDSTENSECSSEMEKQNSLQEAEEDDSIFEEGSFQFVVNAQTFSQSKKTMEEETKGTYEGMKLQSKKDSHDSMQAERPRFYSFQKVENKNSDQKNKFEHIPVSLIEEEELPLMVLDRKVSIRSFESLREYEDSLNESELYMMLRRFDSHSDIEAGLFQ